MYKLLVNQTKVHEGSSLMVLIRELIKIAKDGDGIDIYQRKRTRWELVDGGVWKCN